MTNDIKKRVAGLLKNGNFVKVIEFAIERDIDPQEALNLIVEQWGDNYSPNPSVSFDIQELEDLQDKMTRVHELTDAVIDKLQRVRI